MVVLRKAKKDSKVKGHARSPPLALFSINTVEYSVHSTVCIVLQHQRGVSFSASLAEDPEKQKLKRCVCLFFFFMRTGMGV